MSKLQDKSQSTEEYITFLRRNSQEFADTLTSSLKMFMFENRYTIHPRRIRELGQKELNGLVSFLREQETASVVDRGKRRAEEGLGFSSVLTLGPNFRQFFLKADHPQNDEKSEIIRLIDAYITAYLSGYMAAREDYILKEQARLRTAYEKAKDTKDNMS